MTTTPTKSKPAHPLSAALWRIFRRPDPPPLWAGGGNLPWNNPAFSERMLREHLTDDHGAASRNSTERQLQLDWLWEKLALEPGARVLDITCGPGLYAVPLAERGCLVTGIDFGPAAISYANHLASVAGVSERCTFIEQDVRTYDPPPASFDAALLLYGQLAVFPPEEAADLLAAAARALRPGGRLVVELLDQSRVDKSDSTWWYTDDKGLWGERPYLHLGERRWDSASQTSAERFYIIDLATNEMAEVLLCDQTYAVETMVEIMQAAGFSSVDIYPAWGGLPLYDAAEWVAYVAEV